MMDGKWKHDDTINLSATPTTRARPGIADKIELPDLPVGDAAWPDFQAGNVDIAFVGSDHLGEATAVRTPIRCSDLGPSFLFLGIPLYDTEFQSKECARRCRWRSIARP